MIRRLRCHVLPLIFVLWFAYFFMAGGEGILFALIPSYPTILVVSPVEEALPLWAQWTTIFACGYIQCLLVNYLLLKGYCLIKRRSAHR